MLLYLCVSTDRASRKASPTVIRFWWIVAVIFIISWRYYHPMFSTSFFFIIIFIVCAKHISVAFVENWKVNRLDIIIYYEVICVQHLVLLDWCPFHITCFRDQFIDYWIQGNMLAKDLPTQIYTLLKQPRQAYLVQVCFVL